MINIITSKKAREFLIDRLEKAEFKKLYQCYKKPSSEKIAIYYDLIGKYNNMIENYKPQCNDKISILKMGIISYNKYSFVFAVIIQSVTGKFYYLETPTDTKLAVEW